MPSKMTTAVQELREAIAALGGGITCTTKVRRPSAMGVNEVALLPFTLKREPAGGGKQRHYGEVIVVVRGKLNNEDADNPACGEALDLIDQVYEAIPSAAALKAGGAAGVEEVTRGVIQYVLHPQADAGAAAIGIFSVTFKWLP